MKIRHCFKFKKEHYEMKFWTHPDYHNQKLENFMYKKNDISIEKTFGNFKIKYIGYDNSSYFGIFNWKGCMTCSNTVEFYENDQLLFTKEIRRPREFHFVITGDGKTKENTFFLWYGKNEKNSACVKISNFNDEHIKDTSLGPDCYTGLIQVSNNYFVVITEEMCTYSRFFGLVNIEKYFVKEDIKCWNGSAFLPISEINLSSDANILSNATNQITQQLKKLGTPYNNARIGICVDWYTQCDQCMEPIEANEDGLIFADVTFSDDYKIKKYTTTDFVKYDDVEFYDQ